ncbi:MAG: C2H2-type zinc finger protein [Clostridia bacterium]|nr:C2H2-type zinc finger protein [Clostridia bacterium]
MNKEELKKEKNNMTEEELNNVAGGLAYENDYEVIIDKNNQIISEKRFCNLCNKEFKTEAEYKEHMKNVHNQ